jgi:uncharacterized protein (UPF0333 family)
MVTGLMIVSLAMSSLLLITVICLCCDAIYVGCQNRNSAVTSQETSVAITAVAPQTTSQNVNENI